MFRQFGRTAVLAAACLSLGMAGMAAPARASGSPTGGNCGTIAGLKCASKADYCKTAIGACKITDAKGICTRKPKACPKIFAPVCGCNGKTFANACVASAAGVNVATTGKCKTPKG